MEQFMSVWPCFWEGARVCERFIFSAAVGRRECQLWLSLLLHKVESWCPGNFFFWCKDNGFCAQRGEWQQVFQFSYQTFHWTSSIMAVQRHFWVRCRARSLWTSGGKPHYKDVIQGVFCLSDTVELLVVLGVKNIFFSSLSCWYSSSLTSHSSF